MRWAGVLGALLTCALAARPALAQPADGSPDAKPGSPGDGAPKPWAVNVSDDQKQRAFALFQQGNDEFAKGRHTAALALYRKAIAEWDHPSIRFNIAVTLIRLQEPIEAYENLEKALKYGAEPLDPPSLYEEGITYRKLLEGQLARVTIECDVNGAAVSLDGQKLFTAPGEMTRLMRPGSHQVVAKKDGYATTTKDITVMGGKPQTHKIKMITLGEATETKRRWSRWKPYAVIGAGLGIAAIGLPLQLLAASNMDKYDRGVESACPRGCSDGELEEAIADLEGRAKLQNALAISAFITGGAVLGAGIVLVIMNQPRAVPIERPTIERKISIVPAAMPGGAGVTLLGRF